MYRKTGFVQLPHAPILMDTALRLIELFKGDLDKEIAAAIRSLSKSDTMRINNFFFERLLSISHPKLDTDTELKAKFIHLLSYFLRETGYIDTCPVYVDYVTDPATPFDEAIELMLSTRLPKFSGSDMNNEFANVDTLSAFLPEVIRRYAICALERLPLTERLYRWIGTIGYKILQGQAITQTERTAFVMYSCRDNGSPGCSEAPGAPVGPIRPAEQSDPFVTEAGALYGAVGLTGPFTNHMKIVSDTVYERLTMWIGLHHSDMRILRGTAMSYGPFTTLDLTPQETIPWTLEDQLTGLTAVTNYFAGRRPDASSFSVRVPHIDAERNARGWIGVFPDDPTFRLSLSDKNDCSKFVFEFNSAQRQRWLSSLAITGVIDVALAEAGLRSKTLGACQVEKATLDGFGLMKLTDRASSKVATLAQARVFETYLLPTAQGLSEVQVDVTPLGARFGAIEARPAFSEFMDLPLRTFMEPAPLYVDYIAAVYGLTADERTKFAGAIAIYHNTERFQRLTGRQAPLDRKRLVLAMLTKD